MSQWTSKPFGFVAPPPPPPPPEERGITFKVKYGDSIKRFYGSEYDKNLDINLSDLRSKVANAFKFGPDAEFILTYTDEDGDAVLLDDDDDLRDAALYQKLNPLRINVQLNSSHGTEQQKTDSESVKSSVQDPISHISSAVEALKHISNSSTAKEEYLAQIKSAVGEAMKAIPEPIPDALAKLSHEVLDSAPLPFAELVKPLVQLIAPGNGSNGSSSSSVTETQMPTKANDEPKTSANFVSQPMNAQKSESQAERVDRSGIDVAAAAAAPSAGASHGQPSLYPSVEELLFPSNSVEKSLNKGKSDAQSKGKSVRSSTAQPASSAPPFLYGWIPPQRSHSHRWQFDTNAKDPNDSKWPCGPGPMHNVPFGPSAPLPHGGLGYGVSPHFPYPGRLLSSGRIYGDLGTKKDKSAERTLHKWIMCDGCGAQPIVGPRYKSNVREDYDLCDSCFKRMGNEVEYTKIDKPIIQRLSGHPSVHAKGLPRGLMKSKREKLESRFILDVTVLDGTLMPPSAQFTKIWRMHNNGSIMWPLGTQLIWVGGDNFSLMTAVPLEIPVNGFPVDKEIDVAVDFVAPARPGRYISYWRLASPSGQKFGQRVWVHIQVEDPSFVNGKIKNAINLNLPPENSSSSTINLIDANMEAFTSTQGYNNSYPVDMPLDAFEPKKSQPTPFTLIVPSVSTEASADPALPLSSAPATAVAPSVSVPTPDPMVQAIPSPVSVTNMAATTPVGNPPVSVTNMTATAPVINEPVSVPNVMAPTSVNVLASAPASASVPVPAPLDAAVSEPLDIDADTEDKLLRELEEMGFKQVDLNKEILRQNKYNLEQSVDDLCGVNEWDPLLAELEEMGFDDTEVNKELLAKNGGSIKRAVMDLIAREKKDK